MDKQTPSDVKDQQLEVNCVFIQLGDPLNAGNIEFLYVKTHLSKIM